MLILKRVFLIIAIVAVAAVTAVYAPPPPTPPPPPPSGTYFTVVPTDLGILSAEGATVAASLEINITNRVAGATYTFEVTSVPATQIQIPGGNTIP